MPVGLSANLTSGADSRCNPYIFRSPQIQADADRNQPAVGHEPELSRQKILPKPSVAMRATAPPQPMRRAKQEGRKPERTDACLLSYNSEEIKWTRTIL